MVIDFDIDKNESLKRGYLFIKLIKVECFRELVICYVVGEGGSVTNSHMIGSLTRNHLVTWI